MVQPEWRLAGVMLAVLLAVCGGDTSALATAPDAAELSAQAANQFEMANVDTPVTVARLAVAPYAGDYFKWLKFVDLPPEIAFLKTPSDGYTP